MERIKRVYFSDSNIEKLPKYKNRKTNESTILSLNDNELLKLFDYISDNKLKTLDLMERNIESLKLVKEFLLFHKYAYVDSEFSGIIIKKGYETSLRDLSKNPNTSFNDKIIALKNIGITLEKLKQLREQEKVLTDFFIGDIHEGNVLVDPISLQIQFIDLDSCKIGNNHPFLTKYGQFLNVYQFVKKNLSHKYPFHVYYFNNNEQTDLYCYMLTIIKILFDVDVRFMDTKTFTVFINALYSYGLPQPLYEAFKNLYEPVLNTNPYNLLEDIPNTFERKFIL